MRNALDSMAPGQFEAHTLIEARYDTEAARVVRTLVKTLTRRELQIAFMVPRSGGNFVELFAEFHMPDATTMRPFMRLDTYLIAFFMQKRDDFKDWLTWSQNRHAVQMLLQNCPIYSIVNADRVTVCRPTVSPANETPSPFNDTKSFSEQLADDLSIHLTHPDWPLFQCDSLFWPIETLYFDFSGRRENLSVPKSPTEA